MKAIIEWIISTWQNYWGDGFYQYLILVSAIYLMIFHRKKHSTRQVLAFSFTVLFVFLFPFTAVIIRRCIGASVYWRTLWLLPTIPIIALAATEFLRSKHSKLVQAVLLLVCCGVIALSGKDMISAEYYVKTSNRQKVPDEIARACTLVLEEAVKDGIDEIYMAADDHVASYARVFDASIHQPYGRRRMGALTKKSRRIYTLMHQPEPRKYRRIAWLCKRNKCNFLVISVPENKKSKIERYGYTEIGTAGAYVVFQLEES